MIDKWFPAIELPLTIEQFHQLPQNPAYKYEYFNDRSWRSSRVCSDPGQELVKRDILHNSSGHGHHAKISGATWATPPESPPR